MSARFPATAPALTLETVGHQFNWEYRYPGLNVVTANANSANGAVTLTSVVLGGNTTFTNKIFFGECAMCADIHICHQIRERIIPTIFMSAKGYFALIRMAVSILHFTQCAIT